MRRMNSRLKIDACTVTEGSGNVFKDLGLPSPEELQAKADLLYLISSTIRKRRLSQNQLAEVLRVSPKTVSALLNCRLQQFSKHRLAEFLTKLNLDVEVAPRLRRAAARGRRVTGGAII